MAHVNIPDNVYKFIQDNIIEGGSYKNVTEFLVECGRVKAQEMIKARIDQRKLDAFYLREEQIRSKNANVLNELNKYRREGESRQQ